MEQDPDADLVCAGKCRHSKHYHLVKMEGDDSGARGCCKVDCACMEFVKPKDPPAPAKA